MKTHSEKTVRMLMRVQAADHALNGSNSDRIKRERDALLLEETAYKAKLEAVAAFRKAELIPVGKLQRAIDESDSESEPISGSEEGTASGGPRVGIGHIATPSASNFDTSSIRLDNSHPIQPREQNEEEDLDAEIDDLDDPGDDSGIMEGDDFSQNPSEINNAST